MKKEMGFLVLAAGKGTRMHSDKPKVLQEVLGKSILAYVLDILCASQCNNIPWVVVGHCAEEVMGRFAAVKVNFIHQQQQLGTGHAVSLAWPQIRESGVDFLCVVNGDTPYVPMKDVSALMELCAADNAALGFLTIHLENPKGYGRVVRDASGRVTEVVEEKDFRPGDHGDEIHEVNSGVYVFDVEKCSSFIEHLTCDNAQQEFYLTQMISLCSQAGLPVLARLNNDEGRLLGINSPAELVGYEDWLQKKIVNGLIASGVIVRNAASVVVGPDVHVEPGAEIIGPCEIYGNTTITRGTRVESHSWLRNAVLNACQVKSFSHIDGAELLPGASVGPFARLRPGTVVGQGARIGNFVEAKNAVLHAGAKAGHLSYLGDSEIGSGANIGAGTITCNYDGCRKHRTQIGERAFIGSNTALVAPVSVGSDALVGAGSVVTKDVPEGMLCVARGRQTNIERKTGKSEK